MSHDHNDPLGGEQMQVFLAGLAGLAPGEIAKAKALYVKNAISDYRLMQESMAAFRYATIFFYIIPIFWPFLFMQRRTLRAVKRRMRDRVQNALDVWGDDIHATGIEIEDL